MKLLSFVALCCCISFVQITEAVEDDLMKYLVPCLSKNGLDLSIFGVSKVEDIHESQFVALQSVDKQKRGCFVACMFQNRGIITPNGTLVADVPQADPKKQFATTFEDAVKACRAEMSLCDLGDCLYGLYF